MGESRVDSHFSIAPCGANTNACLEQREGFFIGETRNLQRESVLCRRTTSLSAHGMRIERCNGHVDSRVFDACFSMRRSEPRAILRAMKIIIRWLLLAAALLLVAYLYPSGVAIKSFGSAMLAAFVLGLLNTLLRPILVLLTLPVTLITLGLFLFVINALMFYFAASVLDGFYVTSFGAALIGSVLYSLCGMVIDVA